MMAKAKVKAKAKAKAVGERREGGRRKVEEEEREGGRLVSVGVARVARRRVRSSGGRTGKAKGKSTTGEERAVEGTSITSEKRKRQQTERVGEEEVERAERWKKEVREREREREERRRIEETSASKRRVGERSGEERRGKKSNGKEKGKKERKDEGGGDVRGGGEDKKRAPEKEAEGGGGDGDGDGGASGGSGSGGGALVVVVELMAGNARLGGETRTVGGGEETTTALPALRSLDEERKAREEEREEKEIEERSAPRLGAPPETVEERGPRENSVFDRGEETRSGGMAGQHYCLRWNNYQSNMTSVFHQLLQTEAFVDVTLACNEASLKAHKVVLSACSSYFQKLLLSNPCKHPTIIMPQDVCFNDLKFIIEFVYRGEIDVSQAELQSLLKTADQLKIKGLCEAPESRDGQPSVSLSSPPREPGTQRLNFTKIKRHHPKYKRARTTFEPRASDSRHYDRYKEEESKENYNRDNKENHRDWPVEDEECTEAAAAAAAVVLETCQRNNSNGNGSTNNNNNGLGHYGHHPDPGEVDLPPETQPTPPSATLVGTTITHLRDPDHHSTEIQNCDSVKIKFETLHTMDSSDTIDIDTHMSDRASVSSKNAADSDNMMMITPELLGLMPSGSSVHSDSGENNSRGHSGQSSSHHHGTKSWTQEDMDAALEALRNHDMSLTKASSAFGIPSTTLWQRAHRLGIDTPKKDGPTKSWSDESLNNALEALRTGTISANKASKAFGIPSSTLYKIARREGIRLAAPFNASPTTWSPADLDRALEAIRSGQTSVQRASTEFGIPTGTLYGRCKREGIELSRSNPTPWSEDAMTEALEAVRLGHMSINQAAIHYNLPYSSLYGRFKRGKYEEPVVGEISQDGTNPHFHQSPTQNHSSTLPDQMPYQGS